MDSGNSGSMQSSSGGDEEYDSRPESISAAAFLNSSSSHLSPMSNSRTPPPQQQHPASHPQSTTTHPFHEYPLSNYMDAFPRSPQPPTVNSLLNLDNMAWARGLQRSDPNCTDNIIGAPPILASSSAPSARAAAYNHHGAAGISPSAQLPVSDRPPPPSSDQPPGTAARSSKKRSRASRRAPTTVLTTDTSNFRAMVQEFTGIPAPPFSASPFPRTRLDLFGSASAMRSAGTSLTDAAAAAPPYLLRPFAHKLQPSSFPSLSASPSASSSSPAAAAAAAAMLDVLSSNTTSTLVTTTGANGNAPGTTNSTSTNNNYLLNVNNNPMFTFQSLLQTPAPPSKYPPLSNLPVFSSKQQGSADPSLRMGMLEDFAAVNTTHGHGSNASSAHLISSLSGLMPADALPTTRAEHNPNWVDGDQARSFGSNNCKLNYGSSSADFHADKGSENVTSRGEGMVDSWICSSD